ncbi:6205_t:CDS:2 [Paraglomus occultum]|uniref:6205_t:CDS:1 n=1 Tax=Paraglomus occultum TaxID=144539 RepID=A0A9N8VSP6_9GLOM|nr:6205_t:CDS:2 [Paraglomus occultum]
MACNVVMFCWVNNSREWLYSSTYLLTVAFTTTEFKAVTYGSAVKLTHSLSEYKLHSHGVNYGSGSGQQSVTGFSEADDPNSLWTVKPTIDVKDFLRGQPVKCNSFIRLQHVETKKFLHSHNHKSPLSMQQEVSAYDGNDTGDNWKLICRESSSVWLREEKVQLMHQDTKTYLTANIDKMYGNPIHGQLEVATSRSGDKYTMWAAQEGVYFQDLTTQLE